MKINKKNQQRYVTDRRAGDIIIDLQGPPALSQEHIPVIGGWKDYTGSGGPSTGNLMYAAGQADNLFGTNAHLMGARDKAKDVLGRHSDTFRLRQSKKHIIFSEE